MGAKTGISWTKSTWNAVRGCTRVDQGCINCYAESVAHRFGGEGQPYHGLTVVNTTTGEPRWNGEVMLVEKHLMDPLRWQSPRPIFVNSMSDFFHEKVPDSWRDKQMAVMALCFLLRVEHIFQVLTKREEEMFRYMNDPNRAQAVANAMAEIVEHITKEKFWCRGKFPGALKVDWLKRLMEETAWPLPNLWLLISANDQRSADKRIPILLKTPAVVRGISLEPLTGPIDLLESDEETPCPKHEDGLHCDCWWEGLRCCACGEGSRLDWVIIGGESGVNARSFELNWARNIIAYCKDNEVPVYMKQLGSRPVDQVGNDEAIFIGKIGKGDNPNYWPEDLQIQQWPGGKAPAGVEE